MNTSQPESPESAAEHSPEPWRDDNGTVRDRDGRYVMGLIRAITDESLNENMGPSEDNTDRIVACVNACAGIPSEDLKGAISVLKVLGTLPFGKDAITDDFLREYIRLVFDRDVEVTMLDECP